MTSLAAPSLPAVNTGGGAGALQRRRHPSPAALPRAPLALTGSALPRLPVGAIFLTMEATVSFPAETIVRRYRDNPERLAAELHEQAEHIKEECLLTFVDLRLAEMEVQ